MLIYPSISKDIVNTPVYVFDKLDGSGIRVEWNRKSGFTKFGTRTRLLDTSEQPLGEAVEIFHRDFSTPLETVGRKLRNQRITYFLEFWGPQSFAGNHSIESHQLTLFDVHLHKQGFLLPVEFQKLLADRVPTAQLLYRGNPNQALIEEVRDGSLEGMTYEGVVCKSQQLRQRQQVRFKIKNRAWIEQLKNLCGSDDTLFNQLS